MTINKNLLLIFISFIIISCSDNQSIVNTEVDAKRDNSSIERLSFSCEDELTEFIENIKKNGTSTLRTKIVSNFTSLYDKEKSNFINSLTAEQLSDFLNDPDEPEFYFNDSIIFDDAFATVLNEKREIELGSDVYKYVEGGIYSVKKENDFLLEDDAFNRTKISSSLDPRIKFYPTSYETSYENEIQVKANITQTGPLTLKNGIVIQPGSIRDLNFKDRGDSNSLTNSWTSIWGKRVVAESKFSSKKKMIVTFYTQDYIIYKSIGTSVKMQKKKWLWWNNCKADQIHLGWEAIEIEQKVSTPAFEVKKESIFNYATQKWETKESFDTPAWLTKNFPFSDNFVMFTVPLANYDFTSKNINSVYSSLIKKVPFEIKKLFPNNSNKGQGIATFPSVSSALFIIDQEEEYSTGAKTKDSKFYSSWFGGEYEVGFSIGSGGSFNLKKLNFRANNTNLKRGIVYGAVKYDGKWLGGRILKEN